MHINPPDIAEAIKVSPLYFFATLIKERNPPYLQLRRRLNGKMFVYPKSATIVLQKNEKKPMSIDCVFR